MYQGRKLKNFYQINDNKYIFQFEDNSKELMSLNSFSIIFGNKEYIIEDIINEQKYIYGSEFDTIKNKPALNFKNISSKKMRKYDILNSEGFTTKASYIPFINIEKDFVGITFDINCKNNEFKILMVITKNKVKFIPIVFKNFEDKLSSIENSKTYQKIKYFMQNQLDFTLPHNKRFITMLRSCNHLDQNSYIVYNLS
jgi:hypothetical protein